MSLSFLSEDGETWSPSDDDDVRRFDVSLGLLFFFDDAVEIVDCPPLCGRDCSFVETFSESDGVALEDD